jgi:hypothetical protein
MWRLADLYDEAVQWVKRSFNIDSTTASTWSRVTFKENDADAIPTPAFNEFSTPIENEASRIGKPEYEPYSRVAADANLMQRDAGELAQQVLQHRLTEMGWSEEEDRGNLHMPLYGGWIILSYLDQSYVKMDGSPNTTRIPNLGAMKCPECDFTTANQSVPDGEFVPPEAMDRDKLTRCPGCKSQETPRMGPDGAMLMDPGTGMPMMSQVGPELVQHTPIGDELDAQDFFSRDLARDVPLCDWVAKTIDPRDFYPENYGVDKMNGTVRRFTYAHVESLDWICNRYANGYLVRPEDTQKLMQYHPVWGERQLFFSGGGSPDSTIVQNSAAVRESYIQPWREGVKGEDGKYILDEDGRPLTKLNKGRMIVTANRVVLYDGDMMVESQYTPGKFFPRVHLEYIPWKFRSGGRELFGVSMSEQLFDPQDNINEIISQIQDARQTMGSPKFAIPRGGNLAYDSGSAAGAMWLFDADPTFPEGFREIGNKLLNYEVYKEIENTIEHIQRAQNTQSVETGGVPPGVAAALAIQMLAEQTNERRRARIRRIREALERVFSHGLKLMHEFCDEERELWLQEKGDWKRRAWTGMQLHGMTEVRIEAEPEHDTAVQEQQSIRDALTAGLFSENSGMDARTRRKIAAEMGIKSEMFNEQNAQEKQAEREYVNWTEAGIPPVVNPFLDDNAIHAERHGLDAMESKFQDMAQESGFLEALPLLDGWNTPRPMTLQNGMTIMAPSPMDTFLAMSGPQAPKDKQGQIIGTWSLLLAQSGFQMKPGQEEAFKKVVIFLAHKVAHELTAEEQKMAAMQGVQQLAAPGGETTAGGTIPAGNALPSGPAPGMSQPQPVVQPGGVA